MDILAGILFLLFGLAIAAMGLRVWFWMLPVLGFMVGFSLGTVAVYQLAGDGILETVLSWIVGLVVGGWFIVRAFYRQTRLPIARQLDELGGAVLGLLFAALFIGFLVVVMDSFFLTAPDNVTAGGGIIKGLYEALNTSALVQLFRDTLIPTFGYVARPFVPQEIVDFLEPR